MKITILSLFLFGCEAKKNEVKSKVKFKVSKSEMDFKGVKKYNIF